MRRARSMPGREARLSADLTRDRRTSARSGRSMLRGTRDRARFPLGRLRRHRPPARAGRRGPGRRRRLGARARGRLGGRSTAADVAGRDHRPPGPRDRADARTIGPPPRTAGSRSSRAPGRGAAASRSTAPRSRRRSRRSAGSSATPTSIAGAAQLDYWVFLDGQLGQVVGDASGEAAGLVAGALIGDVARPPDRHGTRPRRRHLSSGSMTVEDDRAGTAPSATGWPG